MDYQVSARKYRPGAFQEVIGQSHVVQTLVNAIAIKRIAHAFLFSGTRGVGKTTVARILAKSLNCEQGPTGTPCEVCANCSEITQGTSVDVIEIDGASNTGVDDVREIRENVKFTPFRGSYRVYIIDEVHMLSNSAFNALLKTLEEPPAHVVFIFATTEIHKIPATILSRCQHFNFRRISASEIVRRLRHVADQDGITVEDRSLALIAQASEGSMRDGLSLLDQAVAFGGKAIRHADLESLLGAVPREQVRALISAVIAQDSPTALRIIAQLLECGHDLRAYCSEFVEHVRNLLVASVVPGTPAADGCRHLHGLIDLADEDLRQIVADAKGLTADQLQELFRIFSQAEDAIRASPHPRFMLEAAAVRATRLWGSSTVSRATGESLNDPKSSVRHERTSPPQAAGPTSTVASLSSPAMAKPTRVSSPHDEPATSAPASFDSPPSQSAARASTSIDQPTHAVPAPAQSPAGPLGEPQSARPSQESTVADVTLVWEQVVDRVERRHPSIGAFLATGTLLTIEGNQVTVGYPKTASIALTRIQKEETLQMVSGICTELAGRSVRLRVVELIEGQTAPPSLVQLRAAKKQSHKQSQLDQARSHPLVKQALEIFGGDVIEVRQTAPQEETR